MIKLLHSDLTRLRMNRIFWICALIPVISIIANQFYLFWDRKTTFLSYEKSDKMYAFPASNYYMDYNCFAFVFVLALVSALFCAYYVEVEYQNGIFRNKIAIGHSRRDIYLSLFVTNATAGCVFCSIYLIVELCVGIPVLGTFQFFERKEIVVFTVCIYAAVIAFSAILTLITMLASNAAVSGMICMSVVLFLLFFSLCHMWTLSSQEFFASDTYSGFKYYHAGSQNPAYVSGIRREIISFLLNFLPNGQLIEFYGLSNEFSRSEVILSNLNPGIMLSGSAFFTVVPTVIGVFLFGKKDLK